MNALIIKATALNYAYRGAHKTLSGIELNVKSGSVYGFLGPNGSGKTTTLRLLLGLVAMQGGNIELFGESFATNRVKILKRTGSLIESPSLYGNLTARENLEVYRRIYDASKERIDQVLHMVGLEDTGNKLTKRFSLGMRQRLSIALALLPQPELLILDEPANGLDPAGIIELRMLIKKLNKAYGMTILISSHLLSEIEKMVTHIGIIAKGRMIFQGSMEELQLMQENKSVFQIKTSDNDKAFRLLQQYNPEKTLRGLLVPCRSGDDIAAINKILNAHQVDLYLLKPQENNLEELFIELTTNQS